MYYLMSHRVYVTLGDLVLDNATLLIFTSLGQSSVDIVWTITLGHKVCVSGVLSDLKSIQSYYAFLC